MRTALEEKVDPREIAAAMVDRAAIETIGRPLKLDTEGVREAIDPRAFVKTRVTRGSVNPAEVKRMINESRATLKAERRWIADRRRFIRKAHDKLDRAMDRIMGRKRRVPNGSRKPR